MQDFEVRGGYTHQGATGTFSGAFRIYDDNRLVGTMIDSGADIRFNKRKTKLILGINDESEMQLNFWKFSPSEFTVPLVYVLKHDATLTDERYEGKWVPIEIPLKSIIRGVGGNEGLRELEDALKSNGIEETLDILGRIEKSRIQSYLDPNLVRDILAHSQETGHLTLSRVDSFSS